MTRPPLVIVVPKRTAPAPTRPHAAEKHDFPPKQKSSPLTIAQFWLGNRLEERPQGYFLDGTPARIDRIMRETNKKLKEAGQEQDNRNPAWVV